MTCIIFVTGLTSSCEVLNMEKYKDFKVDEGVLVLKEILEVMFASENITLPPKIFKEVTKLQKILCEYLEGDYPNEDMSNWYLYRRCYYNITK